MVLEGQKKKENEVSNATDTLFLVLLIILIVTCHLFFGEGGGGWDQYENHMDLCNESCSAC